MGADRVVAAAVPGLVMGPGVRLVPPHTAIMLLNPPERHRRMRPEPPSVQGAGQGEGRGSASSSPPCPGHPPRAGTGPAPTPAAVPTGPVQCPAPAGRDGGGRAVASRGHGVRAGFGHKPTCLPLGNSGAEQPGACWGAKLGPAALLLAAEQSLRAFSVPLALVPCWQHLQHRAGAMGWAAATPRGWGTEGARGREPALASAKSQGFCLLPDQEWGREMEGTGKSSGDVLIRGLAGDGAVWEQGALAPVLGRFGTRRALAGPHGLFGCLSVLKSVYFKGYKVLRCCSLRRGHRKVRCGLSLKFPADAGWGRGKEGGGGGGGGGSSRAPSLCPAPAHLWTLRPCAGSWRHGDRVTPQPDPGAGDQGPGAGDQGPGTGDRGPPSACHRLQLLCSQLGAHLHRKRLPTCFALSLSRRHLMK